MKTIFKKLALLTLFIAMTISGAGLNTVKAAVNPTFAEQFPNSHTAQVVADAFGKLPTDEMDSTVLATQNLELNNKGLTDITGIEIFTEMRDLQLNQNQLTTLPDGITMLSKLVEFEAYENGLTELPANIGNLKKLNYLIVCDNNLSALPDSIGGLDAMWWFNAERNQLTQLPDTFGNMGSDDSFATGVTYIYLDDNKLTSLPDTFVNLRYVWLLTLNNNDITQLPDNIGSMRMGNIELDGNELTYLPDSIGDLTDLVVLQVPRNHLKELPTSIGNLTNLETLNAANNQLVSVPDSIGNLNNLLRLGLGRNQLTNLPSSIANLTQAEAIVLYGNLLAKDGYTTLTDLGLILDYLGSNYYDPQNQLNIKADAQPVEISTKVQFDSINLFDFAEMEIISSNVNAHLDLTDLHDLSLVNYVDENAQAVDINTYFENGKVIKQGTVYAQIESVQDGIFQTNESSITVEKLQLNFIVSALNSYQLSFDLNGGTGIAPESQQVEEGAKAVTPPNPTREGYKFKEWNTTRDGLGSAWAFETSTMPATDVVLYAQWEKEEAPNPITEHTLSFDLNGGTGIAPESQQVEEGAKAVMPPNPTREGYKFKEWNTTRDGIGSTWVFETQTMPANDVTLYAQWETNSAPVVTANATQTYEQYSTVTAEQFLLDVAASMNEEGTLSSDFTTVVDLNVVGDNYQVTVSGVNQFGNTGVTTVNVIVVEPETPNLVITANDVELTQKELADAITADTLESELLSRSGAIIYDKITQEEYGPLMIKPADLQLVKETKVGSSQEISIIYEPSVALASQDNKTDATSSATQQVSTKIQVTIVGSENGTLVQTGENNVFAMIGIIFIVVGSIIIFFKSKRKYNA